MIISLSALAALVLSVLLIFIDSVYVQFLLIPLLIIIIIFEFFSKKKQNKINSSNSDSDEWLNDLKQENKQLAMKAKKIEELYHTASKNLNQKETNSKILLEDVSFLCTALPLMKELASLVITKTEESAINLTENIFQISNKSSQVGNHISSFLQDMFAGEKSLKNNIDILNREMKRINKLIEDFSSIKKRYTVDMKKIEENVQTINGFLSGIRDVSDRTGLLAINSSIEAARVGNAGKGFSVLAGEIQLLASTSKDISLQIDEVVEVISTTVEDSFNTLESEITITLNELSETQRDLNDISSNLDDKVSDVEEHVMNSDSLSKTVTEQLNNVSVNMQYQDITRQILEHIMSTLYFYRNNLEEKVPQIIAGNDIRDKKEKIIKKASSYFTIEDEWKLFGLDTVLNEKTPNKDSDDFKGNVELF